MNLRWLWFDHIPLELEVPKEARGLVMTRAAIHRQEGPDLFNVRRRGTQVWIFLVCLGLVIMLIVEEVLHRDIAAIFVLFPAFGLATWFGLATRGPFVRRALCERGYLCCVKCGYVHTGLSKDVKECPECGAAREFGKCIHCNSPQDWAMTPHDKCTQCGRLRLS